MTTPTILQVTASLGAQGGVERGTIEMAKYINSQNYTSIVASSGGELTKLLTNHSKHINIPLHKKNPISIILNGFRLAKAVKKNNVNIIHARSRAPAWSALIASKLTKTPFITTFHGTHGLKPAIKKIYNSSMVRGQHIIAISEFIKDHIITNYNISSSKISVAPRGFDEERFNPDNIKRHDIESLKKKWDINDGAPIIIFPGRLTRWKGHEVFIDALANMKDLKWHAVIVGGADKKTKYKKEITDRAFSLGLENKVHFVGLQENMPLVYSVGDVIVSGAIEPEAFGRTAVEAQAMAKPIIATAHGGSLENIQDSQTGFLVMPKSVAGMAKILRSLIEDLPQAKQMGDKGRKWVQNNFTVRNMCAKEFAVYKKILGE